MSKNQEQIEDFMFNLKFQSKQFKRESEKQLKEAAKHEAKTKDNMRKGNREAAQIYAGQVIASRTQSARYLQMAVRFDILHGSLKTQQMNQTVTKDIAKLNVVVGQSINPEQIMESSKTMTQFNALCEQMGIQNQVVQNMMGDTANTTSVQELMSQIETEIAVDTAGQIKDAPVVAPVSNQIQEDADLARMQAMLAAK